MADHGRAFQFQRLSRRWLEVCALDARATAVERLVSDVPQIGPSARLADLVRIGLFVERMGCNARRRRSAVRGHALKLESMIVEGPENGVAPPGTQQSDAHSMILAMCMAMPRKPEHGRNAREYAGIAGASEHDHVHIQLQGALERLRSELRCGRPRPPRPRAAAWCPSDACAPPRSLV